MKTTGVAPEALAASISLRSRLEMEGMEGMSNSFRGTRLAGTAGYQVTEPVSQCSKRVDAMRGAGRGEGVVVELGTEGAGVNVGRHPTRIVPGGEDAPRDLVEPLRHRRRMRRPRGG